MGIQINKESFTKEDYERYQLRLQQQLQVLEQMVQSPGFGGDINSFGSELEVYIIDKDGLTKPINKQLLAEVGDPRLSLELNQFNLEYNLSPIDAEGRPFSEMAREIVEVHDLVNDSAANHGARIVPIGILPTLTKDNIAVASMTDLPRFRALSNGIQGLRGKPFQIHINGKDPLTLNSNDITLEGANTSFQFHIRVPLKQYCNTWNAVQMVTPLVLALASNSPTLFGHSLWHETRIALFKQSVDNRNRGKINWRKPARVSFGHGWLREGPWEHYAENVALYEAVLPVCGHQNAVEMLTHGDVPELDELRLHQSTVWSWNRAVYDPELGGHFRIECRSLPAGPTAIDMVANSALLAGLAAGFRDKMHYLIPAFPFTLAEYNFYRAAQKGIDANVLWPDIKNISPVEVNILELLDSLLPVAEEGLHILGVDQTEISKMLGNIQNRIDKKITGAIWQSQMLQSLEEYDSRQEALHMMLERYIVEMRKGRSIACWDQAP